MNRRSLATLAVLVALPAGILTTAAISSAGAQAVPQAHAHALDATAIKRAFPATKADPVKKVRPVETVSLPNARCSAMRMNHAHTSITLECVGHNVTVKTAETAAARLTNHSNTRAGAATPASRGYLVCVDTGHQAIDQYGNIYEIYNCVLIVTGGGGGGS